MNMHPDDDILSLDGQTLPESWSVIEIIAFCPIQGKKPRSMGL